MGLIFHLIVTKGNTHFLWVFYWVDSSCHSYEFYVDDSDLEFFSSMIHRKCRDLGSTLKVFDEMLKRNMVVLIVQHVMPASDCIHG